MIQVLWSSLQYIYTQIQIHIGCKYKYNNRGQICYVGVVVGVVEVVGVVVRNIFRLG